MRKLNEDQLNHWIENEILTHEFLNNYRELVIEAYREGYTAGFNDNSDECFKRWEKEYKNK